MKLQTLLGTAALVVILAGCDQRDNSSASGAGGTAKAPDLTVNDFVPVHQTSFAEVTSQLDPGGSIYGYLATDQWFAGLATNIAGIRDLVLELPDVEAKDRDQIRRGFGVVTKLISECGVEDLTGVGLSGVQITPELYRTKVIFHHNEGAGKGLLWNVFGKQPHALAGMDLLTTNTAIAGFGDVDIQAIWATIERELSAAGVPELSDGIRRWPVEFEKKTKLSWSKMLGSLNGEVGLVLTLDDANRIGLPIGSEGIEFPAPGLMLVVKVNNDLVFNRISSELKQNTMVEITEEKGLKMYAMPLPIPLPLELKITVASSGDYLFIASSPQLVRDALAVRAGQISGLRQTEEAQSLVKYLPAEGNQFTYVSQRFSATMMGLQKQLMEATGKGSPKQMELFQRLFGNHGPNYGMSISAHTPTGWKTVSVGSQDSATALVAVPTAAMVGMVSAIAIPNFVKARETAQRNACINNLRQIENAKQMWVLENNKTSGDIASEQEIASYLKGNKLPVCPKGGRYTIGTPGEAPTCSERGHVLNPK